ncbi:DUF5610 domain-containing protein [Marinobacter xestospongiae]|uniref:DUF5610 domain-containing protein n=1 Tax=Marinobacter xestospongiae TaxID=994319 RepID=A0ABU3VUF8_9GAMM|nr:DUF5610 domain-containing protein [Marinobacter xestospongiae]MDV2077902.1 DUF5610 domain-containing protein [Marinobacter xestospongiae]
MAFPITGPGTDSPNRFNVDTSARRQASTPAPRVMTDTSSSQIRSPQDAINVLRTRLDQQMQQVLGNPEKGAVRTDVPAFEPPSAADVASRMLGFVQARLQQEADNGADQERLANLLEQARAGIEKGFGEAREQIKALGMMNDTLAADIDDSFGRIQEGLDDLEARFLGSQEPSGPGAVERSSMTQVEASSRNALQFEVRTRDGDIVTVSMNERAYAGARTASVQGENGSASSSTAVSLFSGRYEFSVEGELDEGERQALTELFEDVQSVSSRFFDGDVQGAFEAAQSLGIGGEELASFSLNLSSTRTVRASTYESVAQQNSPSAQLRPLGDLAQSIRQLGQDALENGLDTDTLGSLMTRMMDDLRQLSRGDEEPASQDYMGDFFNQILQRLQSSGTDAAGTEIGTDADSGDSDAGETGDRSSEAS